MNRRPAQPASQHAARRTTRPVYPFAAIVGQEEMKLALLLNAVEPAIGGVLIMGHRGTGKSTVVRALADLLPEIWRVKNCAYGCDPADATSYCAECEARLIGEGRLPRMRGSVRVVDLPLGATEDRVCGAINIERAISAGIKAYEPGLLARAHRGFLYIDEVNLLEDHLIDLLLDVAATGRNTVEREGISIEHPSAFVLVGSGNPEEGELRPQLLDRFGLHVEVTTVTDLDQRVGIVELREGFDRDPDGFRERVRSEQEALRRRIARARNHLRRVEIPRPLLRKIAELCLRLNVDGHRGELTITRAARALAAFEGRRRVTDSDVRRVALMALRHRLRRDPFEPTESGARVEQQLEEQFPEAAHETEKHAAFDDEHDDLAPTDGLSPADDLPPTGDLPPTPPPGGTHRRGEQTLRRGDESNQQEPSRVRDEKRIVPPLAASLPVQDGTTPRAPRRLTSKVGSASRQQNLSGTSSNLRRGRYIGAVEQRGNGERLALDATLRARALRAGERKWRVADLRYKKFSRKRSTLFIFAVDTSGSMAANRIGQAKGALYGLLRQSYVRRDRVALICFRQERAEVLLPPSASMARAARILEALPVGGSTPLAAGIVSALEMAGRAARAGGQQIILLLFTDGRSNVPLRASELQDRAARRLLIEDELSQLGLALHRAGVETMIVDTQQRFTSRGRAEELANRVRARYVYLPHDGARGQEAAALQAVKEIRR